MIVTAKRARGGKQRRIVANEETQHCMSGGLSVEADGRDVLSSQ